MGLARSSATANNEHAALACLESDPASLRLRPPRHAARRRRLDRALAKRRSWAPPSRVELWADDPRRDGETAVCGGDGGDAPHRPRLMSPHKPSLRAQSRINREAAGGAVPLSRGDVRCWRARWTSADLTEGAFDITYAAVGRLYDYRSRVAPSDAALAAGTVPRGLEAARAGPRARARCALRARACASTSAASPRAMRWTTRPRCCVRQRHPPRHRQRRRRQPRHRRPVRRRPALERGDPRPAPRRRGGGVLPLEDVAISTSGDYERFFERRRRAPPPPARPRHRQQRGAACAQRDHPRRRRSDQRGAVQGRLRARARARPGMRRRCPGSTRWSSTPRALHCVVGSACPHPQAAQ